MWYGRAEAAIPRWSRRVHVTGASEETLSQNGHTGVAEFFAEALAHHKAGNPEESDKICRQILAADSGHADSLNLLGLNAFHARRHEAAVELIGQAITTDGAVARYHANLGLALAALGRLDEAVTCQYRAIGLDPEFSQAFNNLGVLFQLRGRLQEAAACFRRSVELTPDYPEAWGNLGNTLKDLGALDEAVVCYGRALELRPGFVELLYNLGNVLRDQGKLDDALLCYRRALALKPDYAEACCNLGTALHELGRFEEAFATQVEAKRLGNDPCLSFYEMSRCRRFTEADQALVAEMESTLDGATLSNSRRSMLHFALGKISDDLGNYGGAIRHFDEANRLASADHEFDIAGTVAFMDWARTASSEAASTMAVANTYLPVFIVGLPRSGTTLIEQILASHPDVAAGEYLDLLVAVSPDVLRVTDKMPYNFMILGHLHRMFPQARIIHCRRNPVDTALSLYFTRFAAGHDFAYRRSDIVDFYQAYRRQMDHWRAVLPADRLIEIDYERLVADPESVSRDLVTFCGLDWDEACLASHETDRPIATASAWQARQPIYDTSADRWRHYEPWLGEFRALLQDVG
jgi:tetratricopeptide (TPR) repeat protein